MTAKLITQTVFIPFVYSLAFDTNNLEHNTEVLTTLHQLSHYKIPILEFARNGNTKELSSNVLHHLLHHKIVAVVNTANISDPESILMQQIVNNIGIPIDQSFHFQGQYLWDIIYDETLFKKGAIGNGLTAFDFHTENSFDPDPVRYFGMHYLQNHISFGGENQFISIDDILQLLTQDEINQLLNVNVAFKAPNLFRKETNHESANGTILFANQDSICLRFRHNVILRDQTNNDMLALVDKVYDIIVNISNESPLLIMPDNTMLFWDNWHFLHSRKEIFDARRHLRRILFNPI